MPPAHMPHLGNPRKITHQRNTCYLGLLKLFLLCFVVFRIIDATQLKRLVSLILGKALHSKTPVVINWGLGSALECGSVYKGIVVIF